MRGTETPPNLMATGAFLRGKAVLGEELCAVCRDGRSVDKSRVIRGEKGYAPLNFFRFTQAASWDLGTYTLVQDFLRYGPDHLCSDVTGTNCIGSDALGGPFLRQ